MSETELVPARSKDLSLEGVKLFADTSKWIASVCTLVIGGSTTLLGGKFPQAVRVPFGLGLVVLAVSIVAALVLLCSVPFAANAIECEESPSKLMGHRFCLVLMLRIQGVLFTVGLGLVLGCLYQSLVYRDK